MKDCYGNKIEETTNTHLTFDNLNAMSLCSLKFMLATSLNKAASHEIGLLNSLIKLKEDDNKDLWDLLD